MGLNQEISHFHQIKLRQRALSESEALTDGCWVFPKLLAVRVVFFCSVIVIFRCEGKGRADFLVLQQ